MPFVDGESLRDRMTREGQLPLADALRLTAQVADALAYAHAQGVVHRDIKPENILLSGGYAKVADFGIALAATSRDPKLTQTGFALGTPTYMSPEQMLGDAELDGRSDLYSLGCVLFEMLSGAPPFAGANAQALMAKRLTEDAPRVTMQRATEPPMVDLVLARALARDPGERHATIGEFGAALLAELSGSSVAESAAAMSVVHGAAAPPSRVPLIGREKELDAGAFLARLATGKGGVLLIGGEPGVGKTRLSTTIMDEARAQRALCVTGHCYEMEGMPPFTRVGPLQPVERLAGLAAAAGNWDVAEGHFRSALAFVDEIGDRLGKPAVQKWYAWMLLRRAAPGDHDQARVLLDDAIASFRAMGMQLSLGEAEALRASLNG